MKKFMLLLLILLTLSCETDEENHQELNLNNIVEFSVRDEKGADLLNPNHPNRLKEDQIKIYYIEDGAPHEVYDPNMDYPRNFYVYKHDNEYRIKIFLNHTANEETPTTIIEWNNMEKDTIESNFIRNTNALLLEKVWLNKNLIWDRQTDPNKDLFFQLNK
jgi:hypothetical protein